MRLSFGAAFKVRRLARSWHSVLVVNKPLRKKCPLDPEIHRFEMLHQIDRPWPIFQAAYRMQSNAEDNSIARGIDNGYLCISLRDNCAQKHVCRNVESWVVFQKTPA